MDQLFFFCGAAAGTEECMLPITGLTPRLLFRGSEEVFLKLPRKGKRTDFVLIAHFDV